MDEPRIEAEIVPELPVPEIRDYTRINAELSRLLDDGHPRVRLAGVERQRLLVSGLRGGWRAIVEVDGIAGPELGAGLDAPQLTVICRGAADGVGRDLRAGRIIVDGEAGDAVGYGQRGGSIFILGRAGHRAGLAMAGGLLALFGPVGRLAGDRQTGGRIAISGGPVGPFSGHAAQGGRLIHWQASPPAHFSPEEADAFIAAMTGREGWTLREESRRSLDAIQSMLAGRDGPT